MGDLGKLLILVGLGLIAVGVALRLASYLPGGGLPGDIVIERKSFTFVFPLGTSLVLSAVLTLLFYLFGRR